MNLPRLARTWLPLAAALCILCGLVYVCVQQMYRHGADDPQIQLAEDAARARAAGAAADAVLPGGAPVDLAHSAAPWIAVYDAEGRALAASGLLDGAAPSLPAGLFPLTQRLGRHTVTWMPRREVRMATVLVAVDGGRGGFVAAGRSLREVEKRESQTLFFCVSGLLGALAGTLALALVLEWALGKNP